MQKTLDFINGRTNNFQPKIGIILGSGLGDFASEFESVNIPYSEIPGFEKSTVKGHQGNLIFTEIPLANHSTFRPLNSSTKKVVMMQGRFHYYEGHPVQKVVYPVKIMKKLGVETLIITNAAGGVNKEFKPADLMIITDHINFMGTNPLMGENDDTLGTRFPDMSEVYKKDLIKTAKDTAKELGFSLREGVYAAFSGPSYETPAEINMLRTLGADAVGMSTVPEAIVANYCGIKVLGISCITNAAAGDGKTGLSHAEVIETSNIAKEKFNSLLLNVLRKI